MSRRRGQLTLTQAKYYSLIFIVIALIMIIVGAVQRSEYSQMKKSCTESVQGIVMLVNSRRAGSKSSRHTEYRANVSYTVGSSSYTCQSGYRRSIFYEGSYVEVCYDPEEPQESYVVGAEPNNGFMNIYMGVLFGGLAAWCFMKYKKKAAAEPKNDFDYNGF